MEISLTILLIPYGIALFVFGIFAFFSLYHMFKYGFVSFPAYIMTFIFLGGIVMVLYLTYALAIQLNWSDFLYIPLKQSL